jgi:hypothetical protein
MDVETFRADVAAWLAKARDPRWKRPFTELTYQPMQEVLTYFRANGYKTYIVTGGGQDFVRVYSERVYGVPPEQVVGNALGTKYGYDKNGKPFLTKEPKLLLNDDNAGKPEGIHLEIGRMPLAAFGNSAGDRQMLEYTKAGDGARLSMIVLHDDGSPPPAWTFRSYIRFHARHAGGTRRVAARNRTLTSTPAVEPSRSSSRIPGAGWSFPQTAITGPSGDRASQPARRIRPGSKLGLGLGLAAIVDSRSTVTGTRTPARCERPSPEVSRTRMTTWPPLRTGLSEGKDQFVITARLAVNDIYELPVGRRQALLRVGRCVLCL